MLRRRSISIIGCIALSLGASPLAQPSIKKLQIVVVAGEDAVNVVQQRTAVAPVVEVRDENNQPVAGAIVRFAIRGGNATFGGANSVSLTTNTLGQATASQFTPTAAGAVRIDVVAAAHGQSATTSIAQTNYATAAQAATGGKPSGSGSAGKIVALAGAAAAAGGAYALKDELFGGEIQPAVPSSGPGTGRPGVRNGR